MKKLLVIAYFFPPSGAVGVYRTLKFVKYLPEFGWEPVVLTVSNGKTPVYDESLMKLIPAGVEVHRVPSWEALNEGLDGKKPRSQGKTLGSRVHTRLYLAWHWLALPDVKLGWVPNATKVARRLLRENRDRCLFDCIDSGRTRPRCEHAQDAASRPDVENDVAGPHHFVDRPPERLGANLVADLRSMYFEFRVHRVR